LLSPEIATEVPVDSVGIATTSVDRTPVALTFKVETSRFTELEVRASVPLIVKVESVVAVAA
jgi:hypothetical protein